jgi:hypothetical protein
MERQEKERLLRLFQTRMDLARAGALAYREGKVREAVQNYFNYIEILERTKGAARDTLDPKHFDAKKDIAELLLLSGVFWDLAKIHDVANKKDTAKLSFYLDRFVVFSKGLPYQHLSSELLRKYLANGTPRHRKEFKDAHLRLGGGKCFIATALEDDCEPDTLPRLRLFRDQSLMKNPLGRFFVSVYYSVGPSLARVVLRLPRVVQLAMARFLVQFARKV